MRGASARCRRTSRRFRFDVRCLGDVDGTKVIITDNRSRIHCHNGDDSGTENSARSRYVVVNIPQKTNYLIWALPRSTPI